MSDIASMLAVAAVPAMYAIGVLGFPLLLLLVFLGTLLDAPGNTARRAMLPDLATSARLPIERAAALHDGAYRLAQLVGAPVGGILIIGIGTMNVLIVDAASFAMSAVLIGVFTAAVRSSRPPVWATTSRRYVADLHEGLTFIRRDALLPSILLMFVIANMLDNALFAVLLPTYAVQILNDPVVLGICVGALGAGSLAGTLIYAAIGHRLPRRGVLVPALLIAGTPKFLVLAAFPDTWVLVVTMVAAGLAAGPVNPLLGAIEFERIPAALRGRVLGALMACVMAAVPLATLGAGLAAQEAGLRPIFMGCPAAYLLIALIPLVHQGWKNLSPRHSQPA